MGGTAVTDLRSKRARNLIWEKKKMLSSTQPRSLFSSSWREGKSIGRSTEQRVSYTRAASVGATMTYEILPRADALKQLQSLGSFGIPRAC